jgi:hypothetical protein
MLCDRFIAGAKGERLRTGEIMVIHCRKAWRVVHRLFPEEFPRDIANPWSGATMNTRVKLTKKSGYTRSGLCVRAWLPRT